MPLDPPQAYRKTAFTHRRDTRANQPLATDVLDGTLYYVTDETVLERSTGIAWQSYSAAVVSPYTPPTYTPGSVLFAGAGGAPTEDNTNFFFNDTTNQLQVAVSIRTPLIIGGTGVNDDLHLQSTSGVGTTNSRIFFDVGNNGAIPAVEIKPDSGGNFGQMGIGTPGNFTVDAPLCIFGTGADIGYLIKGKAASGNPSAYFQVVTGGSDANAQAGFSFKQNNNSFEWRAAVVGNDGNNLRFGAGSGGTDVKFYITQRGNIVINSSNVEPSTGTFGLFFGDGTIPATMVSNSAGLYANDVGGTVQMFGINEAGESTQLTGVPTFTTSSTGTVNDLATGVVDIVYCDNATDLTLTGMAAGVDGQRRMIVSRGAGNVFLSHQTGSATANQFSNNVTSGPTPLLSAKGSAVYEYDLSITRWRLINHTMGGFISSSFSAGEFTGNNAMTWTVASGDVTFDRYTIINRVMFWQFRYLTTTVGGTPDTTLQKTYPSGYTGIGFDEVDYGVDNGTAMITWISNNAGNTGVNFFKQAGGNWAAATDTTAIRGNLAIGLL